MSAKPANLKFSTEHGQAGRGVQHLHGIPHGHAGDLPAREGVGWRGPARAARLRRRVPSWAGRGGNWVVGVGCGIMFRSVD